MVHLVEREDDDVGFVLVFELDPSADGGSGVEMSALSHGFSFVVSRWESRESDQRRQGGRRRPRRPASGDTRVDSWIRTP